MKKIISNKGCEILIDKEDFSFLAQWSWHITKNGYAARCSNGKKYYMHRIINNTPNGLATDHINGNKLDNRKRNLRTCTLAENSKNRKSIQKNNTSGYKGVSIKKGTKKWRAVIRNSNKYIFLGYFSSKEEAVKIYNEAALKYHGVFSKPNEVFSA